jgi:hypothetical protein
MSQSIKNAALYAAVGYCTQQVCADVRFLRLARSPLFVRCSPAALGQQLSASSIAEVIVTY